MDKTEERLIERIREISIQNTPYPHFYTDNVFPEEFYDDLINNLPEISCFSNTEVHYPKRFTLKLVPESLLNLPFFQCIFWNEVVRLLSSPECISSVLEKFQPQLKATFGDDYSNSKFHLTLSLVRDQSKYAIGPHTDCFPKLITLLFYLPRLRNQIHLGTSIYMPKIRGFECNGEVHHSFGKFDKIATAPFLPNSVFGFIRTKNSFHGVEPIEDGEEERVTLAYTLWEKNGKRI